MVLQVCHYSVSLPVCAQRSKQLWHKHNFDNQKKNYYLRLLCSFKEFFFFFVYYKNKC